MKARALRPLVPTLRATTLAFLLASAACSSDSSNGNLSTTPTGSTRTSFSRIQTQILDRECISCHVAGNAFATQSGLVLTSDKSYDALLNVVPVQSIARSDGLRRIVPGKPDSSFFWHKLIWEAGHHQHDYASPMPLGTRSLSIGQLEFVKRWIAAGAPKAGDAIDTTLLADTMRLALAPFAPLPLPPRGIQLHIDPFSVAPQFERELFVYRKLNNAAPVYINRVQTKLRPNSHHVLLYSFEAGTSPLFVPPFDAVRDIRNADGSMNVVAMIPMAFHVFFAGAQTPEMDYTFPDGVALMVPANFALDFNTHFVNHGSANLTGEAYANLFTVDAADVKSVAHTINMPNTSLVLPPNTRTTLTKEFTLPAAQAKIFMLTSHMHALGERFRIRIAGGARNGEVVYDATDWSHPDIKTFSPALVLNAGERLVSEITWNNTTSHTVNFGLSSMDEMGIIFGYYY
jgi:hypothetical protein